MDRPRHRVTASRRFWIIGFALISLGVVAAGLAYYRDELERIRQEKYQDLATIANLKIQQIQDWRKERLNEAGCLSRGPILQEKLAQWLHNPGDSALREAVLKRLQLEQTVEGYSNVFLVAPDGRLLLSVMPEKGPFPPEEERAIKESLTTNWPKLSDLFRSPQDDQIHLDVAEPILDSQSRPLAVVVMRVNLSRDFYPIIKSWPAPSHTAETLLVERNGEHALFLNDLRHRPNTALSLREPLTALDRPAVQAIRGKKGMFEGQDYRHVEVLADLRPVPSWPWVMVTKVDKAEILAEARYRAVVISLFVVLFIILTGLVAAYGYRARQFGLLQDLYRMEQEQREVQEEFSTTLYSIGDAVITTDMTGLVKQMNRVAERLTGWPEAEARGRPLEEVFPIINEHTRAKVENPVHRVLREGRVVGLANHTLLIARDGSAIPIADSGAPIRGDDGAVIGVVLVFRDQTQERMAQRALEESEELYRSLFDNMLNGFAYCQMLFEQDRPHDFIYLNVNNAFEELTGLKDVVGKKVSEVIPGIRESAPEMFEIYGRVALTGTPAKFETYVEAMKMWFSISVYSPKQTYFVAVFDVITERKQAEEALRASEERYRTVADYTYDMEYWINEDGQVVYMSPSCERFTGYPAQAFLDDSQLFERTVHPQDLELFLGHMQEAYSGAGDLELDFRLRHCNGQECWVSHSCQPVFGKDGRPLGRRASNRDITARKRAEEALRKSEEKYRLLVSQIPAVVFQGYADWSIDFFDRKIEALTGYLTEEFNSRQLKWFDLILPEDRDQARQQFTEALHGDKSYRREYRIRRKDGAIRWVQSMGQIFCDAAGRVDYISGVFFDISDRKEAEKALQEQTHFLQTLLDTIPSPIFYKNAQGIYLGCNHAFSNFLGMPKEEIIGKTANEVFPKDIAEKYLTMDAALLQNPGVQLYDFVAQYADGTTHDVNFHKATYLSADGQVAGLVGVMIDIAERKRAEAERLRFSKLESLATLAGGIAHDFNNILTAIMGNISLAMLDQPKGPIRKNLSEAERACIQARNLSRQLLTFAKGGAPIKQLVSVADLLTETVSFTCTGSKTSCTFDFPDDLWALEADPGQINQVIQNLTINALQAMPTGGTIEVKGENLEVAEESDLPLEAGKYVKISIRDQGAGIPANYLSRIFDPYFTTKQTGSGLGLATAYSVVHSHHGHISVASILGEGTTFTIYLPAVAKRVEMADHKGKVLTGQGKVLVMDDEDQVRLILGQMLQRLGYQVGLARDGAEALAMYNQARESGQPFGAVILDLTVPGGMGGKETLENLRKIDPQVQAIVSSGYSEEAIMAEFAAHGFSDIIAKPYRISELARVLKNVLHPDHK